MLTDYVGILGVKKKGELATALRIALELEE